MSVADELAVNQDAPKTYIVKKGDTLWDISGVFLKEPWLWPKLWRINPEVNNPHLIFPGDVLRLVYDENGEPMLVKEKPQLKWSPESRKVGKDEGAVGTVPLSEIAPFLKYDSVFTEQQLEDLPYIIGSDEGYKRSIDGFNVYVNDDLVVGKSYAFYRKGDELFDLETGESLGYYAVLVGTGKALATGNMAEKKPSTVYVDQANREIRQGTYVLPVNSVEPIDSYIEMKAATEDQRGVIIKSISDIREFGRFDVVMINRGSEAQIEVGQVMAVKRTSPAVVETSGGPVYREDASAWERMGEDSGEYVMPEEDVGNLMVFKVYPKVSMAIIVHSSKPLRLKDIVTAP